MILSARLLDTFDRCPRRLAFERSYSTRLISPFGLLYRALEYALTADDPEQAAKDETMRIATTHELILRDLSNFLTIRHTGYLAAIIALALRNRLGPLARVPATPEWESSLFSTESGTYHRIELVSHFDDDRLRASAHSWRVIGELAALEAPLTLTAVVVGPQRTGRRHSEWSKGLRHPVNRALRFAPRQNKKTGFGDTWEKVWREQTDIPTLAWLNQMKLDGVLDQLIVSREIAYNSDDNRMIAARREMKEIAALMPSSTETSPMRRSSCDEFGGCPFQSVCYSPTPATPASFPHLYFPLDRPHVVPAKYKSPRRTGATYGLRPSPAAPEAPSPRGARI